MSIHSVNTTTKCNVICPKFVGDDEKCDSTWEPSCSQRPEPTPQPQLRLVAPSGGTANTRSIKDRKSFDALRGIKVILLLVGLALCLVVMKSSPEWEAIMALRHPIEPIVLYPTQEIQVSYEMVFPQVHMFTSPGFAELTGDKHIWAYMQSVDVGERYGLVYYFRFRNENDASCCLERIHTDQNLNTNHQARQFKQYAVLAILTNDSGNPTPFFESVFRQIEENSKA